MYSNSTELSSARNYAQEKKVLISNGVRTGGDEERIF